ncbi:hypothetical protein F5Y18DRAFT_392132 [Xylariaceae sp. FL1019]|nr:hypothetical protein F5Y18DRAFT_392132 [Xylariaceae sp. FL1019]
MSPKPSQIPDEENQLAGGGTENSTGSIKNMRQRLFERSPDVDGILIDLIRAAQIDLMHSDTQDNTTLNIATLQRMVLFQLQRRIMEKSKPITNDPPQSIDLLEDKGLMTAIADYTQGIRDWELMVEYGNKSGGDPTRDPFCISSKWSLTSDAMKENGVLGRHATYHAGTLNKNIGIFKQRNQENRDRDWRELTLRFSMAVIAGVALIGPMLLMVLHKGIVTDLVTTSVAVVVVSAILSRWSTAAPEVMVGTIAAYAAVLVVFVGTLQPGNQAV